MSTQEIAATKRFVGLRSEALLLAILAVTAIVHLTSFQSGHNWGGDFSAYIHQAMSLVNGDVSKLHSMALFRAENSSPDAMVGPALYPWGFPVLLSSLYPAFGAELLPFRVLILAFVVASQAAVFYLLRGRLSDLWVLFIVFVMGMNPAIFEIKNDILSDLPFLFVVFVSLVLMEEIEGDNRRLSGSAGQYLALGLLILATYFIRTHGVVLIGALAVAQVARRWPVGAGLSFGGLVGSLAKLRAVAVIPYGVFAVGLGANAASGYGGDASYLATQGLSFETFGEWLSLIAYNVAYYAWLPSGFLGIGALGKLLNLVLFLPLALLGVYLRFNRDRLLVVFTVFYMTVLIVWPFQLGVRSVLPVIPMYLYFGIVGAMEVHRIAVARWQLLTRLPSFAVMFFVPLAIVHSASVSVGWTTLRDPAHEVVEGPYTASSLALFEHIRAATPETAVITFWRPRVLMLFTGRRAVLNVEAADILNGVSDFLLVYHGDYWDQESNVPLQQVVDEFPGRFSLKFSNSDFALYRILANEAG